MRELLVETPARLEHVIAVAHSAGRIGLDTEFLRERTYRARLCLVQIAAGDEVYVVDALAKLDLKPVADLVAAADVETVVHAGRQDFDLLFEYFGVAPRRVFDVQVAAGFAGYGASLSLGRLVEEVVGEKLEKGEAYTDWCRRPLTPAQLHYAANDVVWLLSAADILAKKLHAQGRTAWAHEEMRGFEDPGIYGTDPNEAWRKVSGRGTLSAKKTAVLKAVARWREETAARRDIPRNWVVKEPTLVEIARRAPKSLPALKAIRGMNAREAERSAPELLSAIKDGLGQPPIPMPRQPPKDVLVRARMISGLADVMVRARCERAGIATEVVTTRGEIEVLVADLLSNGAHASAHRLLEGWRRQLVGDAIVSLAQGRVAVRVVEGPPYVEEVVL
ncbi:MAG: ribonuclease D [Actinomycetota bacterium]